MANSLLNSPLRVANLNILSVRFLDVVLVQEGKLIVDYVAEERYESLMKSYGIPISGDTNAKRDALRSFIGLPVVK